MSPGEIAYRAYCAARGWKSVRGERLPKFDDQAEGLRVAWQRAAQAVIDTKAHEDLALIDVLEYVELIKIGKRWNENSSLEKWFPITAEELQKLKQDNDRMREALIFSLNSMEAAASCVQNEIRVREMLRRDTGVWPDVLTGCHSEYGLEEAISKTKAALKKEWE